METIRMSSKGQVIVPKAVRDANGWAEGTMLTVINGGKAGVTFKELEPETKARNLTVDEFLAIIPVYAGPEITDEMMREGINAEAKRRWHAKGN